MNTLVKWIFICLLFYSVLVSPLVPRIMNTVEIKWLNYYILLILFPLWSIYYQKLSLPYKWFSIVCFFCSIVFLSILWSPTYFYDFHTLSIFFFRYVAPALIIVISYNIFNSMKEFDFYIINATVAATIISILAIIQTIWFPKLISTEEGFRASVTFGNPNILAIFLVLLVPCILVSIERKNIHWMLGYFSLVITACGVVSTMSRKGIITLLLSILTYYAMRSQWKKLITVLTATLLIICFALSFGFLSPRFKDTILKREFKGKINLVSAGITMFKKSPLYGLGYSEFYENVGKYNKSLGVKKYDAHNMYITVMVNQGILGLFTFFLIFLLPLIWAVCYRNDNDIFVRQKSSVCVAVVFPFLITGIYAGGLIITQSIMFVFYSQVSMCLNRTGFK